MSLVFLLHELIPIPKDINYYVELCRLYHVGGIGSEVQYFILSQSK